MIHAHCLKKITSPYLRISSVVVSPRFISNADFYCYECNKKQCTHYMNGIRNLTLRSYCIQNFIRSFSFVKYSVFPSRPWEADARASPFSRQVASVAHIEVLSKEFLFVFYMFKYGFVLNSFLFKGWWFIFNLKWLTIKRIVSRVSF